MLNSERAGIGGNARADIREKVKSVILRVTKIPMSRLRPEKLVREDLGVDSMQAIEMLTILEKELKIIIDPEKAFHVETVHDLFQLIEESVAAVHA